MDEQFGLPFVLKGHCELLGKVQSCKSLTHHKLLNLSSWYPSYTHHLGYSRFLPHPIHEPSLVIRLFLFPFGKMASLLILSPFPPQNSCYFIIFYLCIRKRFLWISEVSPSSVLCCHHLLCFSSSGWKRFISVAGGGFCSTSEWLVQELDCSKPPGAEA